MTMARDEGRPRRRERHEGIDGLDLDRDARVRGAELGDDPAGAGQRPDERLRLADRLDPERVTEQEPADIEGARDAADRRPGDDPDVLDSDRLSAGIPELVQELVH